MKISILSSVTLLFALQAYASPVAEAEAEPIAEPNQGTSTTPGAYIVTLNNGAPEPPILGTARKFSVGATRVYTGTFDEGQLAQLRQNTAVRNVEPDGKAYALALVTQIPADPGLGAISRVPRGLFTTYTYDNKVCSDKYAYVIDTGIRTSHQEFGGRASYGWNFVANNNNANDDNGHGTHCAGTIAGSVYGVFKSARVVGVKVLNAGGSGTWSQVIAGVAWSVQDIIAKGRLGNAVISMSLGGGVSTSVNSIVDAAVYAGIPAFVAAGNSNADAGSSSPASASQAFAVGAHESGNDCRASFSNYGSRVKIYAPGVNVRSAWYTSDTSTVVLSGTSMATPHVAGLALYFMCQSGYNTPASIQSRILQCGHSRPSCAAPYDYKSTDPNEIAHNCT